MTRRLPPRFTRMLIASLTAAACLSLLVLAWFSYTAVREWQRSQELLADQRATETVDLLITALRRDMRGVQESVLSSGWEPQSFAPPYEIRNLVASAFARYPYPESFFVWRAESPDAAMLFFNRSDRQPAWMPAVGGQDRYPVSIRTAPDVARAILERVRSDVRQSRRFSTFETTLGRGRYQVVARLFYRDPFMEQIDRVVGFTVNLSWVRERYFPGMARQVNRIANAATLEIVDDRGLPLVARGMPRGSAPIIRRWFPVMFFDPLLVGIDSPSDLSRQSWAVQVRVEDDAALAGAIRGANRTLFIATLSVAALALGLVLTARAARDSARLAEMRSDFVSTVTHELKTPIATIRAVGDTLLRGRISDPHAQQEYAQLVVQESKRLTRLVENLLAYARITDVTEVYAFEPLALADLVDGVLKGFAAQLENAGFDVEVDLPDELPPVRGDRTALGLALDNLVDNAIRYSGTGRRLDLRAFVGEHEVVLEISDRGIGIVAEEVDHVTRRFYRGREQRSSGSGLGLAIVKRIVEDHGGRLAIHSTAGQGTTVRLELPAAEGKREEADTDR